VRDRDRERRDCLMSTLPSGHSRERERRGKTIIKFHSKKKGGRERER